ncbi:MAG: glycosyltransferase family 2 protein, partial [Vicinamibacteria bacterium]
VDLGNLPPEIVGLDGCERAFFLIRLQGRPVGKAIVPVFGGCIQGVGLRERLVDACGWPLFQRWLHDYLDWDDRRMMGPVSLRATVAVCSRDRTEDLQRCLDAVMRLPDDGQDLLVVDNCPSTDETHRLVARYPRARYVRENRPGLDIARNRALREARTDVVAFTDDDAAPDPSWLRVLLRNFDDPRVLCVTGLTMPLELQTRAQEWFERHSSFSRGFVRQVFDRKLIDPLAASFVGAGANMALRRSVLDLVGPFDEALDAGTPTFSGGDTEMFSRILGHGYRIVYDPASLSWHRHRREWDELRRTIYGYGVGVYAGWTRRLIVEKEKGVLILALKWLLFHQLPGLARSALRLDGHVPLHLLWDELRGCMAGPRAYFSSVERLAAEEVARDR